VRTNGQLKKQTHDLLLGLGSCRAEVEHGLRRLGVRAVPNDPQSCAVALYLGAVLGGDLRVQSLAVHRGNVKIRMDGSTWFRWPRIIKVSLPRAVQEFIEAFDEALYPDLIRDEAPIAPPHSGAQPGSLQCPRLYFEQDSTDITSVKK
jgi:hypothetical protein